MLRLGNNAQEKIKIPGKTTGCYRGMKLAGTTYSRKGKKRTDKSLIQLPIK